MRQGFNSGLVRIVLSSQANDMSVILVVASNIRHGSYTTGTSMITHVSEQRAPIKTQIFYDPCYRGSQIGAPNF